MTRTVAYPVRVEFGDCDPAGIVWFPNFFRWIDAASRHFFIACGVPPWAETSRTLGVIGTPLVDTHAKFIRTATYGDALQIDTSIGEWRGKSFVQRYRVLRGDDLLMECDEVRIFAGRRDDGSLFAHAIPPSIRALCEQGGGAGQPARSSSRHRRRDGTRPPERRHRPAAWPPAQRYVL